MQFESQSPFAGFKLTLPHQFQWLSQCRVTHLAVFMLLHPQHHVVGVADVVRAVGAAQDVDVKGAHVSGVDLGRHALSLSHPRPFSLSLSKAGTGQCPGFDRLSPNG
ncbi:hypothetical protein A1D30_10535 [Acidovorax sp. GW101-3H11]|nr:hypothetical protein A1D30_10535 [Acidovorax sp. GW101-3H11]